MSDQAYISEIIRKSKIIAEILQKEIDTFKKGQLPSHWEEAFHKNKWFTPDNICYSLEHWVTLFSSSKKMEDWLHKYEIPVVHPKRVLLILPGNVPLVGLHDVLCTLFAGHQAYVKLSSDDLVLMKHVFNLIEKAGLVSKDQIVFKEQIGKDFDAVIATGSNLSANTFRFYFHGMPSIIRGHRNSIAVLSGNEAQEELEALADDVFVYFGLGCRNVSFFLVPENYDWSSWLEAAKKYAYLLDHTPYSNNYLYYRGYFGMMLEKNISDCGFYLLRPHEQIHSPIAVLHYKTYYNMEQIKEFIEEKSQIIQCVVSNHIELEGAIPFGTSQKPTWDDYADNLDVMNFLTKLS